MNTDDYKKNESELTIDFSFEKLIINIDDKIGKNELNEISYTKALRIDNRSAFQIFVSVITKEIGILNLYFYKSEYSQIIL